MRRGLIAWAIGVLFIVSPAVLMAEDSAIHSSSFDSAGVKIVYFEAGTGEPVVLVHGLYSSAKMNWIMPGTFKLLAAHYHVIAFDLRGHGESDKPTADAAYGQPMVDDITRLMDHLSIPKAHIVGYSLGGIIVMKFMIDHPDRVISGTLGGMGWLKEGSFEQRICEQMGNRAASTTPPACVHSIAKLAVNEQQVKSIKAPVEMIVGDHDPCRQMYVEPAKAIRPDWPVIIIDGAGHMSCIVKEPFKKAVVDWIDKNAQGSGEPSATAHRIAASHPII
jgi:pimeloyl-ACP methyl ester carboxylesterase